LDWTQYEQGWEDLKASSPVWAHEYLTYHKKRFYELFDHVAFYLQGKPTPRVLEIGISAFTKLYKVFYPHIQLVTVDRPVELYGFDATFSRKECGAETHYNIDLNQEPIGPDYGEPPLGTFDYVIFSEVLEHLTINHIQLFGELLSLLSPTGLLYLTTPNFFSLPHTRHLTNWDNPQGVFPRRGQDHDAGFHFREYTMPELIDGFEQAGGKIVKAYFSDCWDNSSDWTELERTPQFRSDLMVVVCRADAELPFDVNASQWRQLAKPNNPALIPNNFLPLHVEALQLETERLNRLVEGYESGRFIRLMKWLRAHGLPHL
jgi:hypothetical protein